MQEVYYGKHTENEERFKEAEALSDCSMGLALRKEMEEGIKVGWNYLSLQCNSKESQTKATYQRSLTSPRNRPALVSQP